MNKRVAIILINWNSYQHTHNCILSLQDMVYKDFDIILVDNDSKDDSGKKLAQQHGNGIIFIKSSENLGFAGGNNLGIQYASANGYEYVLFLNNDTFVHPQFLCLLVAYMDAHPETGAVQPKIYCNDDRSLLWNGGSSFYFWIGHASAIDHRSIFKKGSERTKEVDWITGCAFLTRSAVLRESGKFAENMFMYYEDVDLSFRIKRSGYTLAYHPQSIIYHVAGSSNKQKTKGEEGYINPVVHYMNLRNRIWILKKYTPLPMIPSVFLFNFLYITSFVSYFMMRGRFTKLRSVLKGIRDGLSDQIKVK